MSHASRYEEWKERFTWENCKLDNKEYGLFISSYLRNSENLIANLNAPWGTGKTEFLKRLYVDLATHKHPVIYIDSWESDYMNNPLSAIISELINQLSYIIAKDSINQDSKIKLKKVLASLRPAIDSILATSGVPPIASTIAAILGASGDLKPETISTINRYLLSESEDKKENKKQLISQIKHHLKITAEILEKIHELKSPVIVIVDELDRCRPDYSIKFIEVIKHFFDIPNFVFLCASDTEQFHASIKKIYGQEFDAENYLRKFFERTIKLPQPSIVNYLIARKIKIKEEHMRKIEPKFKIMGNNIGRYEIIDIDIETYIAEIINYTTQKLGKKISTRDADQILSKLESAIILASEGREKNHINITVLAVISTIMHTENKKNVEIMIQELTQKNENIYYKGYENKKRTLKPTETPTIIQCYIKSAETEITKENLNIKKLKIEGELAGKIRSKNNTNNDLYEATLSMIQNKEIALSIKRIIESYKSNKSIYIINDYIKMIDLSGAIS